MFAVLEYDEKSSRTSGVTLLVGGGLVGGGFVVGGAMLSVDALLHANIAAMKMPRKGCVIARIPVIMFST